MRVSSRFTMAVHLLACAHVFRNRKVTSDFIASSIGTNPVVVRRLLQKLKAAGLIEVTRGTGGVTITRPLAEITLLDIYRATEGDDSTGLFHFHENPNELCPVGRNIHRALDGRLERAQQAFEHELSRMTLAEVLADIPLDGTDEQP
ncbi:Rrf2 family transcriptional regulator [Collinsella sp. An2]|uniref:Rrf2 family transcriptional regulator n=1 Tax=Collinsella sp. An2 TaxID=1965585 RepID=UPI000B3A7FB9|nr:Rrf2 family transcriptional regulator [Collinsella sp. An2]OUP11090.1 transcriptional regulator [Collinsella sp. An2]